MPWVSSHRRRHGWFRTTTVRSHYRRRPGGIPIIAIVAVVFVILLLVALF